MRRILALSIFLLINILMRAQVNNLNKIFTADYSKENFKIEYQDLLYKTIDTTDLKLDIYSKKGLDSSSPVVIFVHGGNWNRGNKSMILQNNLRFMLQAFIDMNYRVASIDYRLASKRTPVNCAISDVKDAVRWIKCHGIDYGIDTSNIVLCGSSAGAHISMMAAYTSDELKPLAEAERPGKDSVEAYNSEVDALINCYGPVNIRTTLRYKNDFLVKIVKVLSKKLYKLFTELISDFSGLSYPEQVSEIKVFLDQYSVDKIKNIRKTPTLSLHGYSDKVVSYRQAVILDRYLKSNMVSHKLHLYLDVDHAFKNINNKQKGDIQKEIFRFLRN